MPHAGHDGESVSDVQLLEMLRVGTIERFRVIQRTDRDSHANVSAQGFSLLLRHGDGMHGAVVVEVSERAVQNALALSRIASGARPGEIQIQRPARKNGDHTEELRILEPQPRRAVSTHAEAFDDSTLALGDGAKGHVDVRQQFLDDDGLHRHRAILRVAPHARRQPIGKNHKHRRDLPLTNRRIKPR